MRSSIKLLIGFLMLAASTRSFAQYTDVNPRTLPAQVAGQENIVQTSPGDNDWREWLKFSVLLQDAGRYRESENAYQRTIALLRAPDPLTVADVFDHMGTMYVESGQLSKADPVERHALAIREHQHDLLGSGVSHMHLAMLLLGQNDLRSAETEAQSAVNLLVPEYAHLAGVSSASPEEKMTALIDLALVRTASGASRTSIPALQWALQIAQKNYPDNSVPVGYIEFLLGYTFWKGGNLSCAGDLMSQGTQKLATQIGWGHPTYLRVLRQYLPFLVETKQRDKAHQVSNEIARLDHSVNSFTMASEQGATVQTPSR
jgi:tetratricopeptide (TPR) repeat protein